MPRSSRFGATMCCIEALVPRRTPRRTKCDASRSIQKRSGCFVSSRTGSRRDSTSWVLASTGDVRVRWHEVAGSLDALLAPCGPHAVSSRYRDMAARLGIRTHIHALRHYSATELLTAGVDLRTVAGRLGHGGGGSTTLKVYAAWVASSDRKAAELLRSRMPSRRERMPKDDNSS